MEKKWIVARTQSNREKWAAENVARQGFEFYLPRIQEAYKAHGRVVETGRPLFPCYLFVRTDGPWRFLTGTFGVAGIILNGEGPAILPDDAVDQLKALEVDGYVSLPPPPAPIDLIPGDTVRIQSGALEGQTGVYEGMASATRQRVLLDYLGKRTRVLLMKGQIVKVE